MVDSFNRKDTNDTLTDMGELVRWSVVYSRMTMCASRSFSLCCFCPLAMAITLLEVYLPFTSEA